jgi:YbbR domain-containing protein
MPFQDIEDESTTAPRTPTLLERWVRKLVLEDWGLKLLAVGITVVLWLAVTGQNKPVTMRVAGVQMNFLKPEGLEISNDIPSSIDVFLTGSPEKLDRIGPRDLIATVDVTDQKAGERIVRLSPDRVKMVLEAGVKIQRYQPTTIPIRLEPTIEAQIDVELKFEGRLAEGYEVRGYKVNPTRIRVRGPADRIRALQKGMTETVWLDGKKESFNLSNVAINISDPRIDILDPTVDVYVEIAEKRGGEIHTGFGAPESTRFIRFSAIFCRSSTAYSTLLHL